MRGIEVHEVFNRFEISKNILTRDITIPGNVGVFVLNLHLQANQVGRIQQNIITMTDGDGSIGIHIGNTEDLQVTDNIVNYVVDIGQDYQNQGINCYASLGTVIQHNVINAAPAYVALNNRGIAVTMSSNSMISCNEIENMGECLHIWGFNMETRVALNEFADGNYGLYLVEPVFLGTQTHTGNEWVGTYNDFGAFIEGDNPVTTAEMSKFIVDSEENPDFIPYSIAPEAVDVGNWFEIKEAPLGLNCETIPPSPPDLHADTLVHFLQADSVFANYDQELQWMRKADLFELLLVDPSLTANAVLDSFFDAEAETVLGQLVQGQRTLDFRYGMVTARKYPLEDTLTLLAADLMEIDSVLMLGPVDSAAWIALRSFKADSLVGYFSDWLTFISDEQSVSDSIYRDMADSLAVLSPGADIEEFLVYALELRIKHIRGIGYTAGELSDIEDLAGMCLLEGGRAALVGHGLYAMYYDSLGLLDPAVCTLSSPLVTGLADELSEPNTISDLVIYPNPGGGLVQVESPDDILSVVIYTIQGQYMFGDSNRGGGRKALVDTSMLDAGVYLLSARTRSGTHSSLISIVR